MQKKWYRHGGLTTWLAKSFLFTQHGLPSDFHLPRQDSRNSKMKGLSIRDFGTPTSRLIMTAVVQIEDGFCFEQIVCYFVFRV